VQPLAAIVSTMPLAGRSVKGRNIDIFNLTRTHVPTQLLELNHNTEPLTSGCTASNMLANKSPFIAETRQHKGHGSRHLDCGSGPLSNTYGFLIDRSFLKNRLRSVAENLPSFARVSGNTQPSGSVHLRGE